MAGVMNVHEVVQPIDIAIRSGTSQIARPISTQDEIFHEEVFALAV
jgi:hypothetical protein